MGREIILNICINNRGTKATNFSRRRNAFTLTEMLVVLVVLGILAAIVVPRLGGLVKSNTMMGANRQLLEDIAYARQRAINDRTKVYMVFVPTNFWLQPVFNTLLPESYTNADELVSHQLTAYALFSFHSLGDQPGQQSRKYLTGWRTLPEGVMIKPAKFSIVDSNVYDVNVSTNLIVNPFSVTNFPFPPAELTMTNVPSNYVPKEFFLPYIAFDQRGQLASGTGDEIIPLVRGSIFFPRDGAGKPLDSDVIVTDTNFNVIRIDRLSGRPKLYRPELQ